MEWDRLGQSRLTHFIIVAQLLAFWPVWKWYGVRIVDSLDEIWGLLPLVTAVVVLMLFKKNSSTFSSLIWPVVFLGIYILVFPFVPSMVRAMMAFTCLSFTLSSLYLGTSIHLGLWGLLLLSLPILPSLQFYVGYPLRVLVANLAVPLLHLNGFQVAREGALLKWNHLAIWIDAPCSGIRMLWVGCYLMFTLACVFEFNFRQLLQSILVTCCAVIVGNTLRATSLFYVEAKIVDLPSWSHQGIGVVVFIQIALAIIGFSYFLKRKQTCVQNMSI